MRLAIADPPYPPNLLSTSGRVRASRWYSTAPVNMGTGRQSAVTTADAHHNPTEWDDPRRHRALLVDLAAEFDGWAIATTPDAVAAVYPPIPIGCKVMVWRKANAIPTGHRIGSTYECVIVYPPRGRRSSSGLGRQVPDVLTCNAPGDGFAGAKPRQWSRWVLDALGYDPDTDEVIDVFPGSGAVSAEVAQGVLP
jgi:hypothetical protein